MRVISKSVRQTLQLGIRISWLLREGDILCLFGQLGVGKTVLVKGIAQGLGISIAEVISPSFTIARQYEGDIPLNHLDLYRLDANDILALGYEEYLYGNSVAVIEWADRLNGYLPKEYLRIEFEFAGKNARRITITPVGERYRRFIIHR